MSGYAQRAIDVTFTRASGVFADGGKNVVTLSGLRTSAAISKPGGKAWGTLALVVHGMTLSMMNDLSTLGMLVTTDRRNTVSVFAGDLGTTLGLVFTGTIFEAWSEFRSMPDVGFEVKAQTGMSDVIQPASPISHAGGADVVVILSALATLMGRAFENNGVSGVMLADPYLPGSPLQQAQTAADHAGINIFDDGSTLAIWPRGGSRGGEIPLISPDTGLVGYPTYTANGLDLTVLFNPSIQFGAKVKVVSSLPQACGIWQVYGLTHNLEALTPGGSWFSALRVAQPGLAILF